LKIIYFASKTDLQSFSKDIDNFQNPREGKTYQYQLPKLREVET